MIGSSYDDTIIGNDLSNDLRGGDGNDTLTGGRGADILNGGAGSDTADYSDATKGVSLNLNSGKSEGDTYISIENLAGSAYNDKLTGDSSANVLTGQGGDDVIKGGDGDDTLLGDFAYQADPLPEPGMGSGYATLGEDATNNSTATAFDISNNFSLTEDPNIFDFDQHPAYDGQCHRQRSGRLLQDRPRRRNDHHHRHRRHRRSQCS